MTRTIALAILAATCLLSLGPVQAATRPPLKSVKVDLPDDRRMFPDGPGADAINGNCLACHSAGMVLNQPTLTKPQWEAEVNKMRNTFKAPIDAKDVDAIVAYLVGMKTGD